MDEVYDVIVLGTGLKVRKAGLQRLELSMIQLASFPRSASSQEMNALLTSLSGFYLLLHLAVGLCALQ